MKSSRKSATAAMVLLPLALAAASPAALDAATFLFSWKAGSNSSITAYGIYQRAGNSAYERIGEARVEDLVDPAHPSFLVTGLKDGTTYWFAATTILSTGAESDLFGQTCITVDGGVFQCSDDDDTNATVYISCFIRAAEGEFFGRPPGLGAPATDVSTAAPLLKGRAGPHGARGGAPLAPAQPVDVMSACGPCETCCR